MIEDEYAHYIYNSNIRKIAALNIHVREEGIKIDKMKVLESIYGNQMKEQDTKHEQWCKQNPHRADLPSYTSFRESLRVQLSLIEQYWHLFD